MFLQLPFRFRKRSFEQKLKLKDAELLSANEKLTQLQAENRGLEHRLEELSEALRTQDDEKCDEVGANRTYVESLREENLNCQRLMLSQAERLGYFKEHCVCVRYSRRVQNWLSKPVLEHPLIQNFQSPWLTSNFKQIPKYVRYRELVKHLKSQQVPHEHRI